MLVPRAPPRDRAALGGVAAAPLPPPAIVSPAPREVSYGRIEGRLPTGTRQVLVRVGGRLLATKDVTGPVRRRRLAPQPRRDDACDRDRRARRRSSTLVGPVYGLPREAAPYAGPIPALRGYEDARLPRRHAAWRDASQASAASSSRTSDRRRGRLERPRPLPGRLDAEARDRGRAHARPARDPRSGSRLSGLLWRMLVYSDDRSANELLAAIGGSISGGSARVNTMMRRSILADSEMYGGYIVENSLARRPIPLEILGRPSFIGKYTTAWDLARLERRSHLAAGRSRRSRLALPGRVQPRRTPATSSTCSRTRERAGADAGVGRRRDGAAQGRLDHEGAGTTAGSSTRPAAPSSSPC